MIKNNIKNYRNNDIENSGSFYEYTKSYFSSIESAVSLGFNNKILSKEEVNNTPYWRTEEDEMKEY